MNNSAEDTRTTGWRGLLARFPMIGHAGWSLGGAASGRLLDFCAAVLVARILGKEGLGAYGLIQTFALMVQSLAALGLNHAVLRFVARWQDRDPERAGRLLGGGLLLAGTIGLVLGGVLAAVGVPMAHALGVPQLDGAVRVSGLLLLMAGIKEAALSAVTAFQGFRAITVTNVVSSAIGLAATAVLAPLFGVAGAIAGLAAQFGAQLVMRTAVLLRLCRARGIKLRLQGSAVLLRDVFRFAALTHAATIVMQSSQWGCRRVVAATPVGLAELGLFGAAFRWFAVLVEFPMQVGRVLLPWLSQEGLDRAAVARTVAVGVAVNLVVVGAAGGVLLCFPDLVLGLFGDAFAGDASALRWCVVAALFVSVYSPLAQFLLSVAWVGWLFWAHVAFAVAALGVTSWAVSDGAAGIASGVAAGYGSMLLVTTAAVAVRRIRAVSGSASPRA